MVDKLGRRLREAREAKGSSLEDAEAATRIRADFLELLEAGDYEAFAGGEVQVRGFLRIYARYLDLAPEDVLGRYSAEVHGEAFSPPAAANEPAPSQAVEPPTDLTEIRFRPRNIPVTSSLPRWMSVKTVMIVGLVLTILLSILALVIYVMNQPGGGQLLSPMLLASATGNAIVPAATLDAGQPSPTRRPTTNGAVTVALEATEHVQVRVSRGTNVVFEQTLAPNQRQAWTDDEMIVVETGNGGAVQITVNGTALGSMGEPGQLCAQAWGPNGEVALP